MEKLVVKNFGPVTSADIDVRQYTLLVGHVSSGKSTIAKLLSIFNSAEIYRIASTDSNRAFIHLLKEYNIDFPFSKNTEIEYSNGKNIWKITADRFDTDFEYSEIISKGLLVPISKIVDNIIELSKTHSEIHNILGEELQAEIDMKESEVPGGRRNVKLAFSWHRKLISAFLPKIISSIYIPAERNIFSIVENNIFSMLNTNVSFPKSLTRFGSVYEFAKVGNDEITIPFLDIGVNFNNEEEDTKKSTSVILPDGNTLPLRQVSSGLQSLIPLFTVLMDLNNKVNAVIEEPESNLFPTVQKDLVRYIAGIINQSDDRKCIITSHSPYILSSFDTLVQAGNASEKNPKETGKIVPEELWIKYNDISCYYFDEKGNVSYAKNDELRNLGSEVIDTVSDAINDDYDKLLNIIYS